MRDLGFGAPDPVAPYAEHTPSSHCRKKRWIYLLGVATATPTTSPKIAWKMFAHTPPDGPACKPFAIFTNRHIRFGYEFARPTRTASQAFNEGVGVCRDYAHLAIALCDA